MDPETLAKACEPFFTRKEAGQGLAARVGLAGGLLLFEPLGDLVDEVFENFDVEGLAVELQRQGEQTLLLRHVEELRFGELVGHALEGTDADDALDVTLAVLVGGAAQGEHGLAV